MVTIKVRIVESARDGFVLKSKSSRGDGPQRRCKGKTQRAREKERRYFEHELNDRLQHLSWDEFWRILDDEHLSYRSVKYRKKCRTMHARLAKVAKKRGLIDLRCNEIDKRLLLETQAAMRKLDLEEATISGNMAALWAMISYGQDNDLIADFRRPRKRVGKREKQTKKSKGRSLSLEEIERLREAIPMVCNKSERPFEFIQAVEAMRLIGLRLQECWDFSWDSVSGAHYPVRLQTTDAAIRFSDIQKSGEESEVPLTNEAIEWLRELKVTRDPGNPWILRTFGRNGQHKTSSRLGEVIANAGRKAGIVVKRFQKIKGVKVKCASSHDLRRTFATNLHRDLSVKQKQKMTRHADAKTLIENYLDAPTPELVKILRNEHPGPDSNGQPAH